MPNFLEMVRFRKCTKDRRAPSKTQSCKLYRLLFPKTKKKQKNQKTWLFIYSRAMWNSPWSKPSGSKRLSHPRTAKRSPLDGWSAIDIMFLHGHRDGFMTWRIGFTASRLLLQHLEASPPPSPGLPFMVITIFRAGQVCAMKTTCDKNKLSSPNPSDCLRAVMAGT